MDHDPLDILEHMKVRPLSREERVRAWAGIAARIPETALRSPIFFPRKAFVSATAFLLIFGSLAVVDSARPGSPLFPIDLAIERGESAVVPSSRASHARERLAEFKSAVENMARSSASSEAREMKMKAAAPAAGTQATMTAMDTSLQANAPALSPELQKIVDDTRRELRALEAEAAAHGDTATHAEIQKIIEEFENDAANL